MERDQLLKQYFGHESFRKGQPQLIDALLSGRDVLAVMPTGAGKSVCYQLPALMLPGMTLVISPLISLMKDQVAALTASGIPSACINSTLTSTEYADTCDRCVQGRIKILYVAPERLLTPSFLKLATHLQISLLAVDEAHCVSQWGQDFRPSYLSIADFVARLPVRPPIGVFTATATEAVKADIVRLLNLNQPFSLTTGFDRPNLYFDVQQPRDKLAFLLSYIQERPQQSGIVYCATRKTVEETCQGLIQQGIPATRYHAGLSDEERHRNQDDFVYDRRRVMVATNAFGMGIDKSNVSYVVHFNMPKDIESYYQEAGRAGRDGEKAQCVLLYAASDVQMARFLINNSSENEALSPEDRELIRQRDLERLKHMTGYCKTPQCLRGWLLRYFGQEAPRKCDYCGNCIGELQQTDITVEAQKILSAVARVDRKYPYGLGVTMIVRMLTGSQEQRVQQLGLDQLSTYGIMHGVNRNRIRAYIDALAEAGYLCGMDGQYPVVHLTDQAWEVLRGEKRVTFTERVTRKPAAASERRAPAEGGLYEALRQLRMQIAQQEGVPAYIVFSNATLADMAVKRPENLRAFQKVSGVGQYKASRYGSAFLEAIRNWERDNA